MKAKTITLVLTVMPHWGDAEELRDWIEQDLQPIADERLDFRLAWGEDGEGEWPDEPHVYGPGERVRMVNEDLDDGSEPSMFGRVGTVVSAHGDDSGDPWMFVVDFDDPEVKALSVSRRTFYAESLAIERID